MDGVSPQETRQTQTNKNPHLAKVRVAGSNPVFRSEKLLVRAMTAEILAGKAGSSDLSGEQ